jgi:hypothetical protein
MAGNRDFPDALIERVHNFVVAGENNALTERDLADFELLLQENEQACRLYVEYQQMSVLLPDVMDSCSADGFDFADAAIAASPRMPFGWMQMAVGEALRGTVGYFSSGWPLAYLITSVFFAVAIFVGYHTPISTSSEKNQIAASPSQPNNASAVATRHDDTALTHAPIVGRITGELDCRWRLVDGGQWAEDSEVGVKSRSKSDPQIPKSLNPQIPASNPQSLIPDPSSPGLPVSQSPRLVCFGDRLVIAAGLLEITYDAGAKVILEGPCQFDVKNNGGFLAVGRLTGKLEKKRRLGEEETRRHAGSFSQSPSLPVSSSAFVIATPTAIVTDLGTEFGVEVNRIGETISHVFRGSVKVAGLGGQKTSEIVLAANDSACVERSGPAAGTSLPRVVVRRVHGDTAAGAAFVRRLAPPRSRDDSENYGRLVLSMKPAVYYRMEMSKDPKEFLLLHDSAPGHHDGTIHFPSGYMDDHPYVYGRFGTALRFRGPMVGDYAIVEDYPKAENNQLAISAWVLAMGRGQPCIIASNWKVGLGPNDRQFGQFVMYFSLLTNGCFAGRGRDLEGREVILQEGQAWGSAFPTGLWQHVVQVFDGRAMRLYRNGVEVASCQCEGLLHNPPLKHLMIGCEAIQHGDKADLMGFWQGGIDELAIFNRTLSPNEIAELFVGKKVKTKTLDAH